ncbi:uncharacterized protein CEXT_27471 [Caerostris extrusa]|uniref:MATH domain-containing protein n=1 Tax=Caerostris extrusa TaxID=172846 RepID=A0AAV4SZI3_CAEEX|nr:uncharacterized protein CEXT_27471 [Caerostris extrusa]
MAGSSPHRISLWVQTICASNKVCVVKPDASMALLYRFTRAKDRAGTGVFTFIVTRSVTRDLYRDATTKEFTFGYHRWVVSFNRSDSKMLGAHLILRNASAATRCYVDVTFCLPEQRTLQQERNLLRKGTFLLVPSKRTNS